MIYKGIFKNQNGFSMPELIISAGISTIIIMSALVIMRSVLTSIGVVDSRMTLSTLDSQIKGNFSKFDNCQEPFKDSNDKLIAFNPTSLPHSVDVQRIYFKDSLFLSSLSSDKNKFNWSKDIAISSIKISTTSVPPKSALVSLTGHQLEERLEELKSKIIYLSFYTPSSESQYTAKEVLRHTAILEIKGHIVRTKASFTRKYPVNFYTDKSDQKIGGCFPSFENFSHVAIADRTGITVNRKGCTADVDDSELQRTTDTPTSVNPCNDLKPPGGNNICDEDYYKDTLRTLVDHPITGFGDSFQDGMINGPYVKFFPSRNITKAGPAPVTNLPEGRCGVSAGYGAGLFSLTTHDDPNDIFLICNDCHGTANSGDGIGCNRENGWRLKQCSLDGASAAGSANYLLLSRVARGAITTKSNVLASNPKSEFCISNDFANSHSRNRAYVNLSSTLTVVCEKIQ